MPDLPTSDELAARTTRAVDAATEAGRELGLGIIEPSVLHDVFSVVVPLAPVRRDGFSMTFGECVQEAEGTEPDRASNAAPVADLHGALRDHPGELPFPSAIEPTVPEASGYLREHPELLERAGLDVDDLERARR